MQILLDTHVFLWALASPRRIAPRALAQIRDSANDIAVSAATVWEICIKAPSGKLSGPAVKDVTDPVRLRALLLQANFSLLDITAEHALATHRLPLHHRDPFDRMLIAQAQMEDLPIVTNEALFDGFGIARVW